MKHFLFLIFCLIITNSSSAQQYQSILHQKGLIDTQFLQKPAIVWSSLWSNSLSRCPMIPLQMNLPELEMNCYHLEQIYANSEPVIFNTPKALIHIFPNLYCEKTAQPYVFFHSYRQDTIWDTFETEMIDPETFESVFRKDFKLVYSSVLDSFDNARFEKEQVRCRAIELYDPETFETGYGSKCEGEIDDCLELIRFQHWAYLDTLLQVKSYPTALELYNQDDNEDDEYFFKFVVPIYPLPKTLDSLNIIWAGRVTITEEIKKFKNIQTDSTALFQARQKQAQKIWKDALGNTLVSQKLDSSEVTKLAFLYDFYLERNGKFYASCLGTTALAANDPAYFVYFEPVKTIPVEKPIAIDSNKKNNKKSNKKNTKKTTKKRKK